jgi:hypothetical protein
LLFFRTNRLMGLFSICNLEVKKVLWSSFVNCFYGTAIWTLNKGELLLFKRAYNRCIKRFFGNNKYYKNRFVYFELNLPTVDTLLINARCRYLQSREVLCMIIIIIIIIIIIVYSPRRPQMNKLHN